MEWIEVVHLRSYSQTDRDEAAAAFHQLTVLARVQEFEDVILLRGIALDGDLCIVIRWSGEVPGMGKSPLGTRLASAFSEFGAIDHSAWMQECGFTADGKENRP